MVLLCSLLANYYKKTQCARVHSNVNVRTSLDFPLRNQMRNAILKPWSRHSCVLQKTPFVANTTTELTVGNPRACLLRTYARSKCVCRQFSCDQCDRDCYTRKKHASDGVHRPSFARHTSGMTAARKSPKQANVLVVCFRHLRSFVCFRHLKGAPRQTTVQSSALTTVPVVGARVPCPHLQLDWHSASWMTSGIRRTSRGSPSTGASASS